MKYLLSLCMSIIGFTSASGKGTEYTGSTPVHADIREFLDISRTDSMDFIRWNLVIEGNRYEVKGNYGLGKNGTPGFTNGKWVEFTGTVSRDKFYYTLKHGTKTFYLLIVNSNLLHLLDKQKQFLVGNGGFSYVLNSVNPVASTDFHSPASPSALRSVMVFEGRTPCQELSRLTGRNNSADCNKLKWLITLYTDAAGKPSHYLLRGTLYRSETTHKGNWEIITHKDGRVFYKIDPEKGRQAFFLLRASENILYFTDPDGRLLVGNEDFSYALNRAAGREEAMRKH